MRRGIFQRDSFSPLLFVIVFIPLSITLNETDLRYAAIRNQKFNNILFLDDLKLCAKSERELDYLSRP